MEKDKFDKAIESLNKVSDLLEKTVESLNEADKSFEELIDTYQTHIDFYKEIYHRVLIFFIYLMVLGVVSLIAMMSIY